MAVRERIKKALEKIRQNRPSHPPKTTREGHHVKVGGGEDRLKKDFSSSGAGESESEDGGEENRPE